MVILKYHCSLMALPFVEEFRRQKFLHTGIESQLQKRKHKEKQYPQTLLGFSQRGVTGYQIGMC